MAKAKVSNEKVKQQQAVNDANGKHKQAVEAGRKINKDKCDQMSKGKKK